LVEVLVKGVAIPGYKLENGRIVRDTEKAEAKLDLCTRLRRKSSKRVRVVKPKG
jgi:hypothetical protein